MKYSNGEKICVGDRVQLWAGCIGIVVASIESGKYSKDYPEGEWSYLKSGVLIASDAAGLIHYLEPEKAMELLQRNASAQNTT